MRKIAPVSKRGKNWDMAKEVRPPERSVVVTTALGVGTTGLAGLSWTMEQYAWPVPSWLPPLVGIASLGLLLYFLHELYVSIRDHFVRVNEPSSGHDLRKAGLRSPPQVPTTVQSGRHYVALEDAGRWLYENANEQSRKILARGAGGKPFKSIAEHGAAWIREAAKQGVCQLYARREAGLSLECVTADEIEGDFLAKALGKPQNLPLDPSIDRAELQNILDWYESDAKTTALPSRVDLADAVMDAWERVRKARWFDRAPSNLVAYSTLREYYERDPSKLPGIAAGIIFNKADPPIPIWGIAPPRRTVEQIPEQLAGEYKFSDDAKEMFHFFDEDKPAEQRKRYINLKVSKADIDRRVLQIERDSD